MSVVCDKASGTNSLHDVVRFAHRLMTSDYAGRKRDAVVLGLQAVRSQAVKQASKTSPVMSVDWTKGFSMDPKMSLNSTALRQHQQGPDYRAKPARGERDERTLADVTEPGLVNMIEIIRAPTRPRRLTALNQRKQELQNIIVE